MQATTYPFTIVPDEDAEGYDVKDSEGYTVAWFPGNAAGGPEGALANANLFVAAALMHDMLTEALDLVPRIGDDDPMGPALVDWCRNVKTVLAERQA